ncbi:unnamed protein product [Heligmosomoides polygyrus]|uniref:Uncharacterized protein n=1 Tax=Heligmosomoides polygyrus TaxID=6339 RepID=A0A183F876_HELPZ|nr:unnamed protein product [Heligmosomoides polygyrus]
MQGSDQEARRIGDHREERARQEDHRRESKGA